jgi:thymidylate synthase (FAD)
VTPESPDPSVVASGQEGPLTSDQRAEVDASRSRTSETRRVTVPALEDILYQPLPVLDRGFIRVIDYLGDDAAIVQAARVSYGTGTKRKRDDAGLIRYLMRHRHTSPFEMCDIKIHAKLPIFVARQWIRHRTACLSGETRLYFDLPSAIRTGRRARLAVPLSKVFRMWHEGSQHPLTKRKPIHADRVEADRFHTVPELARLVDRREESIRNMIRAGALRAERRPTPDPREPQLYIKGSWYHAWAQHVPMARVRLRERIRRMQLRMCDEATGEISWTHITDVWSTGTRPVFRVTLENGHAVKMTEDHRCLTEAGWMTLSVATHVRLNDCGGVSWRGDAPRFAVNGTHQHRDREWLASQKAAGLSVSEMADLAGVKYSTIRQSLRRCGLQFTAGEKARLSGLAQRGQRRTPGQPRVWTVEAKANLRRVRGGNASNFWKGGMTPERALVGAWTGSHAQGIHRRNGFVCVICASSRSLNAHHVDPVWHAPDRARDIGNLTTLCGSCHRDIHRLNLELDLLVDVGHGLDPTEFWTRHQRTRKPFPGGRRKPGGAKLMRDWSRVAKIEYVGEEMTYDLSVAGPFHNFVANGFIVHNSVNEYSGRYSILEREFYIPRPEDLGKQSLSNRQGRGTVLDHDRALEVLEILKSDAARTYRNYQRLIGDESPADGEQGFGLARELARMNLPVNLYTQWYWKTNLHNLLGFLLLRADAHAQHEIRVYADVLLDVVRRWVPLTHEAFMDYRMGGVELSARGLAAVRRLARGEKVEQAESGMSPGEWRELMETLEL